MIHKVHKTKTFIDKFRTSTLIRVKIIAKSEYIICKNRNLRTLSPLLSFIWPISLFEITVTTTCMRLKL